MVELYLIWSRLWRKYFWSQKMVSFQVSKSNAIHVASLYVYLLDMKYKIKQNSKLRRILVNNCFQSTCVYYWLMTRFGNISSVKIAISLWHIFLWKMNSMKWNFKNVLLTYSILSCSWNVSVSFMFTFCWKLLADKVCGKHTYLFNLKLINWLKGLSGYRNLSSSLT